MSKTKRILELAQQGKTGAQIIAQTKYSKNTVYSVLYKEKHKSPDSLPLPPSLPEKKIDETENIPAIPLGKFQFESIYVDRCEDGGFVVHVHCESSFQVGTAMDLLGF